MGCSDSILEEKMDNCLLCGKKYVSSQYILQDDSHYTCTVYYPCVCQFSIEEKRDIVSMRGDDFINTEMPEKNMAMIIKEVKRIDGTVLPDCDPNQRKTIKNGVEYGLCGVRRARLAQYKIKLKELKKKKVAG